VRLSELAEALGAERAGRVRPDEVASLIEKYERLGRPVIYEVEGSGKEALSALYSTREAVWKALGAGGDEEAYGKLLSPKRGELKEVPFRYEKVESLDVLPWVKFYPEDGGRYQTAAIYVACYDGACNASYHRTMYLGPKRAALRMVPRHLYALYKRALERGEDLKVAVVIGAPTEVEFAASLSLPFGTFELEVAAGLAGSLEVSRTPLYGLPVPAGAGAVIEGRITAERVREGPFVDLLHTYDRVREEPVLEVDAVYLGEEPVHLILPGGREHQFLMGYPKEASIWDSVRKVVPRVHKVRLTRGGGMWLHAVVSIEKNVDGDAKNAILAAFAGHPSLKHVVVVDPDVDPDDPHQVEWAVATRFQADRDLVVVRNARGSSLDPSSEDGLTSKMGLDATAPLKEREKYRRVGEV